MALLARTIMKFFPASPTPFWVYLGFFWGGVSGRLFCEVAFLYLFRRRHDASPPLPEADCCLPVVPRRCFLTQAQFSFVAVLKDCHSILRGLPPIYC